MGRLTLRQKNVACFPTDGLASYAAASSECFLHDATLPYTFAGAAIG